MAWRWETLENPSQCGDIHIHIVVHSGLGQKKPPKNKEGVMAIHTNELMK